ncbi:MAG TPA: hypothetical protein VKR06_00735 [Ktedonosporobacter sp.]|nr:hypothetical protein [Ktedonosporobacter sp.]
MIDLKIKVAILVALQVAKIPHALTVVDRLHIQRRAVQVLLAYDVQIGPHDLHLIDALVEEAIQQKKSILLTSSPLTLPAPVPLRARREVSCLNGSAKCSTLLKGYQGRCAFP